ncbi:unnamed protein product, partial [Prorocentrum cordatum]
QAAAGAPPARRVRHGAGPGLRVAGGPGRPRVALAAARDQLKAALFGRLDADGDGRLLKEELRRFAQGTGFDGDEADWTEEYGDLCESLGRRPSEGLDATAFSELVDDEDCYCDDAELQGILDVLPAAGGSPAPVASPAVALGAKRPVGLDYFRGERAAGLYETELRPWDPAEGTRSRSPRLGSHAGFQGCPSTASGEEAVMFLYEQARDGIFGSYSQQAEEVCSRILAAVGDPSAVGWFETRLDENALGEEELARAVLAPAGWTVAQATIPQGYMEHIVTVGRGVEATLGAGDSIVNALHRDVSKCRRLCDTLLIGVVGRKRVIFFAPDEFDVDVSFPRKPDFSSHNLRDMTGMTEHEASSMFCAVLSLNCSGRQTYNS